MMTKRDRLRHLQMRESRQNGGRFALRHIQQTAAQMTQRHHDVINLRAQPQANIGCHLIVARAAGVQAFARHADQLR